MIESLVQTLKEVSETVKNLDNPLSRFLKDENWTGFSSGDNSQINGQQQLSENETVSDDLHLHDSKSDVGSNQEQVTESTSVNDKPNESENVKRIPCRNGDLAGTEHPVTGVTFQEKTVKNADGSEVTGVFPEFDTLFEAQLPEDLLKASDKKQEIECNKQLKNAIENNPKLREKFSPEQMEQILNGDTPDGYTWHHHEDTGKMQLVDTVEHARTGHTGGRSIWGGGSENR